MRIVELEQGSPGWHAWRRDGIGSSDVAAILGVSPWKRLEQVWTAKCGGPSGWTPASRTASSLRGVALEPEIRERYRRSLAGDVAPACCRHEEHGFLRASLDGWSPASATPLEIKAPGRKDHLAALDGVVPAGSAPQCLHILLVTGAAELHYASYNPDTGSPAEAFVVVAVRAEPGLLRGLFEVEQSFWRCVEARRLPRPPRLRLPRLRGRVIHVGEAREPGRAAG